MNQTAFSLYRFPSEGQTGRTYRPLFSRSPHLAGRMTALNAAAAHKQAKNASVTSNRDQALISTCIADSHFYVVTGQ